MFRRFMLKDSASPADGSAGAEGLAGVDRSASSVMKLIGVAALSRGLSLWTQGLEKFPAMPVTWGVPLGATWSSSLTWCQDLKN